MVSRLPSIPISKNRRKLTGIRTDPGNLKPTDVAKNLNNMDLQQAHCSVEAS